MKQLIITLAAILIASLSFAQGGGFNYKALITENGNALANQSVTIKFTVLENGNTSVYQETHTATTDANGIVMINIGEGTVVSGDFGTIDWGGNPNFLKVEIDTGSGYQDFGTTEFKAVPYAKFAEKAGNVFSGDFGDLSNIPSGLSDGDDVNDADHDATNEIQTLSVNSNQLSISQGNTVTLPVGATELNDLSDARSDNDGTANGSSVFIGVDAGANDDQSDNRNIGVGYRALYSNTTGNHNTASGYLSLYYNTTGSYNTASGYNALYSNTTGTANTTSGSFALYSNTTGTKNTASGYGALYSNATGHQNTASGYRALYSNTTGSYNTALGKSAGYNNQTGSGNIFIGYQAGYNETGSNKLYIENSDSATPLIGGDFSTDEVTINGDLEVTQKIKAADSGDADMKAYIYGYVFTNGNLATSRSSEGFSVTKNSTGVYTITFDTPMANASSYMVVATSIANSNPEVITTSNYNANSFKVHSWNLSGNHRDTDFQFVVYKK